MHLKMGTTVATDGIPAKPGFDLPRGAGATAAAKRKAIIPDPRNDENLAVAQTHCAMIRFHNRVRRHAARLGARRPALRHGPRARHQALPVDDPHGLPAAHLPPERGQRRLQQRPQGVRGRRRRRPTSRRCRSSSPSPPSGSGTRWSAPPTTGTRSSTTAPGTLELLFTFSATERRPRRRAAAAEQLDRRLPPALRLRRGRASQPRGAGEQVQPREARSTPASSTRCATCRRRRSAAPGSRRRPAAATSRSATSPARAWCGSPPASRWRRS